jgi:hypothetical protein
MRALTGIETKQTAGGFSVLGVTEIGLGLGVMGQIGAIAGLAYTAYDLGYSIGSGIYDGYEYFMGDSLGGDIYDLLHC